MGRFDLSRNKPFEKHFIEFQSKGFNIKDVFSEFLSLVVYSFANKNPLWNKDWFAEEREKERHRIMDKYKPYNLDQLFSSMLFDLITLMEQQPLIDYLWEFYTYYVTNWENWQFFTPQHICDLMAEIAHPQEAETVYDPACWSGRTLLSACKINRNTIVTGIDIDRRCAYMAIINLFLNWITGTVYYWDSLFMKYNERRRFGINNWIPLLRQEEITEEKTEEVKQKIENSQPTQWALFSI